VEVKLRILYSQKTLTGLDVGDGSDVIYGGEMSNVLNYG
jgi:hypothetical protein